jgi:Cu(I)/Ag(I) efflux system membrane fusion protein
MPDKTFTSKVDFVYPSLSPETRTLKIRSSLPNPQGILKPQMFATVEIDVDLGSRLAVPEDAVMDTGERQIVYVDKGEGLFEPREVKAGVRSGGMREIIGGLKSGERIASSALFLIDSEAQLKGIVAPVPH